MKRVVIILSIIVIIALIGVGCFFLFFREEPPIIIPSGEPIVQLEPSEKTIVEITSTITETQRRNVNVQMPTFKNLTDYTFQEVINKKIADSINPYVNEIAIVADESISKQYKYNVTYERYNNGNYVSIVVLQNYYTGGMRSNVWKDTYTIDVVSNKEMSLADICDSTNYKEIIVKEVNKQAKEKDINLVAGQGLVDIPDTQRFYIKDKKLFIYFEPASIAPYLDGEMHFEMPFKFENEKFIVE